MTEQEPPTGPEEPIGEDEREALQQDLVDVRALKELLGTKGIKGVVFYCPDCDEDHFLAWDLLAGNIQELLNAGESPVHEPAFNPKPEDYVSWDYARGVLDGYEIFGEEVGGAVIDLVGELRDKGWSPDEVKGLLERIQLELPGPGGSGGGVSSGEDGR